ncbi:MAG: PAS domain S-box protein, partial [Arcobacter sp.]|nr:PAS domain S-box protein [Arcobacter sp.]
LISFVECSAFRVNENLEQLRFVNILLVFLLLFSLFVIVYEAYNFRKNRQELNRFRKAVENSDNIVMITDVNQKIKYVNQAFVEATGYTAEEVFGKNPGVIQSGQNSATFYKKLNQTIYSGQKWSGTFINRTKDGKKQYEKATITPIFDEDGQTIIEFVGLKVDITKDLDAQNSLREQEKKYFNQAKMASMGELLCNIAHHWRQPLSLISTVATSVELQQEMNMLTEEKLAKGMQDINKSVQHLSTTIEDFANFFQTDKVKEYFSIKNIIERAINIVNMDFINNGIKIDISDIEDAKIYGYDSELIQAILNILTNAKDILVLSEARIIKIETKDIGAEMIELTVSDSGGGVPEEIMKNIFEPYFTTKHKSQGTGMGLYSSYNIVVNRLEGDLCVKNIEFMYQEKRYFGAKFILKIPKDSTINTGQ